MYLKVCGPTQRHEPQLTRLLHAEFPGLVPQVLALHPSRPWMLVADGGKKLRGAFAGEELLREWRELLPRYAELQRAVTPRASDILALGTPDHRAANLIATFREALAEEPFLSRDRPERLSSEELARLVALLPVVEDRCRELEALGIADTAQHDDLHDGNVLVRGRHRAIFDWGDACVSHPFLTLAVTLRFAAASVSAPKTVALRDAYLEPWSDCASSDELRRAAELGRRIGQISRTLTFHAIARAYPGVLDTYPGGLAGSLRRVLALFS